MYITSIPSTGFPCSSSGTNGSGGAMKIAVAVESSSGACST